MQVCREMKEAYDKMTERLESQYNAKQQRLNTVKQKLKNQAMQITCATRDLEAKVRMERHCTLVLYTCHL